MPGGDKRCALSVSTRDAVSACTVPGVACSVTRDRFRRRSRRDELSQGLVGRRQVGHHAPADARPDRRAAVPATRASPSRTPRSKTERSGGVGRAARWRTRAGPAAQQPASGAGRVTVDVDAAGHARPPEHRPCLRNPSVQSSRAARHAFCQHQLRVAEEPWRQHPAPSGRSAPLRPRCRSRSGWSDARPGQWRRCRPGR